MKLLVDEALRPALADHLAARGYDAVHATAVDLGGRPDRELLSYAAANDAVLLTTDTDFGELLAASGADRPSVLLLRLDRDDLDARLFAIERALGIAEVALAAGAIVVVTPRRIRIRDLPVRQ